MLVCDIQDDYEIIEEEKIMAPSPGAWHNNIGGKIYGTESGLGSR